MGSSQQPAKDAVPTRIAIRALPHRVMPWLDTALRGRWTRVAAVMLLMLPLVLLLGPSFRRSEALWSKLEVGARAESTIKARRDFHYNLSPEELERQRGVAAQHVLPVFDHQVDLAANLLSRINRAFQAMTDGNARRERAAAAEGSQAAPGRSTRAPTRRPSAEEQRKTFSEILQTSVSTQTFAQLKQAGFTPEVRATVILLTGSAMDDFVVAHRKILQPFSEGKIAVRHLVGGRLSRSGEEQLSNLSGIHDLQQAKGQIRHQATVHGAKLAPGVRRAVVDLVEDLVVPNLVFNPQESSDRKRLARRRVDSRPQAFVQGQVIVPDGDEITWKHVRILKSMEGRTEGGAGLLRLIVGIALFCVLILGALHRFAAGQFRRFAGHPRDLVMMGLVLLALLALARGSIVMAGVGAAGAAPVFPYILPVAAGAMLVRLLVSAEAAGIFAILVAAFCGLMFDRSLGLALFHLVTGIVGAYGLRDVQSRSTVLRAGLMAGVIGAGAVLGLHLFSAQLVVGDLVTTMLAAVGGGVLSGFATVALLPAVEWLFAYTTDITLLELANLNHPLLRELMLRAPGTYHHSMVVGSLAETACESIGAKGLLARVASNFHDVGKMKNAAYFAENFRAGDNPHNRLRPSMSGLIIRNHVKDGIEMMRQHGIPELVIDTATQHHGTALIAFFYHKAQEQKDPDEEVREENYRYPGPKPQTREAGVLMLADGVEAAARSLAEPTVDRVRALVQRIINTQFTDGQLDHCDLTLRDLHVIAKSFLQVLRGIYHARPSYPWQKAEESRRTEEPRAKERRKDKDNTTGRFDRGDKGKGRGEERATPAELPRQSRVTDTGRTEQGNANDGQPSGQRKGSDDDEPGSEDKDSAESAPDIRRLGLN